MKKSRFLISLFLTVLIVFSLSLPSFAAEYAQAWASDELSSSIETSQKAVTGGKTTDLSKIELYPGGMPFGVKIISKGLIVVGFSKTEGEDASPAFSAGVRKGDVILSVNGDDINSIEDFVAKVSASDGKEITLTVLRGSDRLDFTFAPKFSKDEGKYKTGLWVKDSASGIGTVTFINPDTNSFAGLGHGICDSSNGKLISLSRGIVMDVTVNGVVKGKVGAAGELKGQFNPKKIGSLTLNSDCGVFGLLSKDALKSPEGKMKICPKEEVRAGEAYIWCALDSSCPQKYKVELSDIDTNGGVMKNFKVKITDPSLIEKAGGIVQGMSGSPIIQNGRIVGAVTHVLINDPTQGYGIFIENMLNAMPDVLK